MTVLGMNQRNFIIAKNNPRKSIRLVNDKYRTKVVLADAAVPVPGTIALIETLDELEQLTWDDLPDAWALKPNRGRRGEGILLAVRRDGDNWRTASGRLLARDEIRFHMERILDAEYSLEGLDRDAAMIEPLIIPHPLLQEVVPEGLPDTRIICLGEEPLMAMMRIPTRASDGKANLHQGAIGAAIELDTGLIFRAVLGDEAITHHPDTGYKLIDLVVPQWDQILAAGSRCSEALRLGYVGADIVVDRERGPLVLECNAFPGLAIQNVNARGLRGQIDKLGRDRASFWINHARKPRPHAHIVTQKQFDRTLGPHPLHPGRLAEEAVETLTPNGESVQLPNLRFSSVALPAAIPEALASIARQALLDGQWDDRGTGEAGALVLMTRTTPPIAIIGDFRRDADGSAGLVATYLSSLANVAEDDAAPRKPLILVCDDDVSLAELIQIELEEAGFEVAIAHDGIEGLRSTFELLPDLIVLDREMPGLAGTEVAKRIRSHRVAREIPIIMLTSLSKATEVVEGLGAGASDYVVKPFLPEELLARIGRLMPDPPSPASPDSSGLRQPAGDTRLVAPVSKLEPSVLCILGKHKPVSPVKENEGMGFSRCERCGTELVRTGTNAWKTVPKGSRVVWRQSGQKTSKAADTSSRDRLGGAS